ncbi:DUF2780 domain-containing protein [Glaciecola sp. SC05]|uniref:DUF2780 domain-containing protein n=1 Tax=Glaciecola sp. SC05 TaxID=1987355 RepID=UPI0035270F0C
MKKLISLGIALLFTVSVNAQQNMLGDLMGKAKDSDAVSEIVSGPNIAGLLGSLTESLGVSDEQAQGGVASIMNYAKQNLSGDDFSALAKQIPGTDSILKQIPDLGGMGESSGMGGLLSRAADKLGGTALLAQQFESLGLDPEMMMGFVTQIQSYLSTPEGEQAKMLLMDSLSGLTG